MAKAFVIAHYASEYYFLVRTLPAYRKNRQLDGDLSGRFGARAYAVEELVLEINAAFLSAHLDVTGELRHAGYIENWRELLRHDNRAIFTAASKASRAADYLRSFSESPAPAE